jgi:hypothetical protein
VPLEQILLSIKDAPKTEIDRLSTVAVAKTCSSIRRKCSGGWSSGGSKSSKRAKRTAITLKKLLNTFATARLAAR